MMFHKNPSAGSKVIREGRNMGRKNLNMMIPIPIFP
jgi:hypothetical protein